MLVLVVLVLVVAPKGVGLAARAQGAVAVLVPTASPVCLANDYTPGACARVCMCVHARACAQRARACVHADLHTLRRSASSAVGAHPTPGAPSPTALHAPHIVHLCPEFVQLAARPRDAHSTFDLWAVEHVTEPEVHSAGGPGRRAHRAESDQVQPIACHTPGLPRDTGCHALHKERRARTCR